MLYQVLFIRKHLRHDSVHFVQTGQKFVALRETAGDCLFDQVDFGDMEQTSWRKWRKLFKLGMSVRKLIIPGKVYTSQDELVHRARVVFFEFCKNYFSSTLNFYFLIIVYQTTLPLHPHSQNAAWDRAHHHLCGDRCPGGIRCLQRETRLGWQRSISQSSQFKVSIKQNAVQVHWPLQTRSNAHVCCMVCPEQAPRSRRPT